MISRVSAQLLLVGELGKTDFPQIFSELLSAAKGLSSLEARHSYSVF